MVLLRKYKSLCVPSFEALLTPYTTSTHYALELQTNIREDYVKFYNHGEGPY